MVKPQNKWRDRLFLIGTGIFAAILALLFYRLTGENAFRIMNLIVIVALLVDNARLRIRIQALENRGDRGQ